MKRSYGSVGGVAEAQQDARKRLGSGPHIFELPSSIPGRRRVGPRSQWKAVRSAAICRTISSMASVTSGETSVPCSKSSSLASDLVSMMLPEIARASRSKRWRKSGSGGEVLGENLHKTPPIPPVASGD
jgi:hypothetical protein